MSRSFIQIKNKDSIYTISAYQNDNCKRTKKKTSEIFCYVEENNFSFKQKFFLIKFGDTLFGNSRSWKRSQGQTTKKYYFSFFADRFGILGEFPLRIWFSHPHGTCRF